MVLFGVKKKLAILALATLGFTEPTIGNISHIQKDTDKNLIETFQDDPNNEKKSDTFYIQEQVKSHEDIINTNTEQLLKTYGQERWMEIIREHVCIELNTVRQNNNLQKLNQNKRLTRAAQEYAKYLSENNRHNHKDKSWIWHRQRIKDTWYPFENPGEVIANWAFTIEDLIILCLYSQEHLNQINWTYFSDVGVWYCNGSRVIDLGGNK